MSLFDAAVIGGGPAGSTTALLLARAGWSVALVERASFPRPKVCGEFLSATNLPLLRSIGAAGAFLALAGPEVRRVGIFAGDAAVTADMPRLAGERQGWGRALGRDLLDQLLLDRAAAEGVRVWQPWHVAAVERQRAGAGDSPVRLILADAGRRREAVIDAGTLVAAHGSWGGRLPTAPRARRARGADLFGFKARFVDSGLPVGLMPLLAFPGGYGGMVHSDRGAVSLSCCIRRDRLAELRRRSPRVSPGDAVLAHIRRSCAAADDALTGARLESSWHATGVLRPGIHRTSAGAAFFVGNAAGEAHPVIAEGISMAMQSAWLLSDVLRQIADPRDAARMYDDRWRRAFAGRITAAAALAHWAMHPALVRAALPVLGTFPWLIREGARTSGKVKPLCQRAPSCE